MTTLLAKAGALPLSDWGLLGRAFFTLARVRVALSIRPWRSLRPSNGMRRHAGFQPRHVEWAIRVASRAVPRATCLTQAVALHDLLSQYGHASIVQVGVRKRDGVFSAHAWVEHEGQSLLGSATDVACYTRFFTWPHSRLG